MPQLSIVVAAYNMQREIHRTLMSFLPPLQQCVDDLDYEIIVVDNGSSEEISLLHEYDSPQQVHIHRIEPEHACKSPALAINAAVRDHAAGDLLMVCIDGARMASSHLVRRAVDVLDQCRDAFAFVGSRHLGMKPQMEAVREGYTSTSEDQLLSTVAWQRNLDWLYAISVWAGAHSTDQRLIQNESNAFALARETWLRMGGYKEGFRRPGGGLCNLELFARYVRRPAALNVLLLGEATFHQVHGGAATSDESYFGDSLAEYVRVTGEHYERPSYSFLADLGERFDRLDSVGKYLFR